MERHFEIIWATGFFRTLVNTPDFINITFVNSDGETKLYSNTSDTSLHDFSSPGTYTVKIGDYSTEISLYLGGVYSLLISPTTEGSFVSYTPNFASTSL